MISDFEAFEYYDEPAHREPAAGDPRRRRAETFGGHVPVRFPADTVEVVRTLVQIDGMTISAWIRRAVDSAIRQRQRS